MGAGAPPPRAARSPDSRSPPTGRPFPLAVLRWAPSNITFALLFGQRFDYQDPVFRSLLGLVDDVMVLLGKPSVQVRGRCSSLGQGVGVRGGGCGGKERGGGRESLQASPAT